MVKAAKGALVAVDPAIKAILLKIDAEHKHDFIIEDLDEEHLLVQEPRLADLKQLLAEALKDTQMEADDSNSE